MRVWRVLTVGVSRLFTAGMFFATIAVTCLPALSIGPEGDLFPLKVKNWWSYKGVDQNDKPFEIKYVVESAKPGKDGVIEYKVTTSNPKQSKFYSKDGLKTMLKRLEVAGKPSASIDFVPAKLIIDSKIRPGSLWQWTGERTKPAGETERWQVFPIEKVKVPAGQFNCLRVGGLTIRGSVMVYQTRWYAANVGLVKAIDVIGTKKSSQELTKYHLD